MITKTVPARISAHPEPDTRAETATTPEPWVEGGWGLRSNVRMLIGTRPNWLQDLPEPHRQINLSQLPPKQVNRDLTHYVRRLLTTLDRPKDPELLDINARNRLADAIVERSDGNFLVAGLITKARLLDGALSASSYPHGVRDAMKAFLTAAGAQVTPASVPHLGGANKLKWLQDMLTPLAFAAEDRLPAGPAWARIASDPRATNRLVPYTEEDIRLVLSSPVADLLHVKDRPDGQKSWSLFHQALADCLARERSDTAVHNAFVDAYITGPTGRMRPRWADADPYALQHLAYHAQQSGRLEDLVSDLEFVVHAEPLTLGPILADDPVMSTPESRRTARVYRESLGHRPLPDRAQRRTALAYRAAQLGDHALVARLAEPSGVSDAMLWRPRWATGVRLPSHEDVLAVTLAHLNGQDLLISAGSGPVRVWDTHSGNLVRELHGLSDTYHRVRCARLDDQQLVIATGEHYTECVWDLSSGELIQDFADHTDEIWDLDIAELDDGTLLMATAGVDEIGQVRVLGGTRSAATKASEHQGAINYNQVGVTKLLGHQDLVTCVRFQCFGGRALAVTCSRDDTAMVWDATTGELLHELVGHTRSLNRAACTELDGVPLAVTTSADASAIVWDLESGQRLQTLDGHADEVIRVAIASVGADRLAIIGSQDTTLSVWSLRDRRRLFVLQGHSGGDHCIVPMTIGDHPIVVTGGGSDDNGRDDYSLRVWSLEDGSRLDVLPFPGPSWPLTATEAGDLVVVSGNDICIMEPLDPNRRSHR